MLHGSDPKFDCLPLELSYQLSPNGNVIRTLFLLNISIVFIIVFGNLLTIMTIINAKLKHPKEFNIFSHGSTLLLVHLAICDIVYCLGKILVNKQRSWFVNGGTSGDAHGECIILLYIPSVLRGKG